MTRLFTDPAYQNALLTSSALAVACALLSVLVVLRRWAFIGEGISHAGFGGVGTCWLASLLIPALGHESAAYSVAVLFCILMAVVIGYVSRRERINADAAIGIVLVASLAWGFIALAIYARMGGRTLSATGWDFYLLGEIGHLTRQAAIAGVCISCAVIITLAALAKEILCYCIDPTLAQTSGVRAGFIHYLLMILVALVIVVGMRLAGYLLVTALLVLPGATALAVSRKLGVVLVISTVVSLIGTIGGLALKSKWTYLPIGPAMVLVLIGQFAVGWGWGLVAKK